MHKELYHQETYLKLFYVPFEHIIIGDWIGKTSPTNMRKCFDLCLEAFDKYACGTLVHEFRYGSADYRKIEDYIQDRWLKKAHEQGFKALALVHPPQIFETLNMAASDFETEIDGDVLQIRNFKNRTPALNWLESMA